MKWWIDLPILLAITLVIAVKGTTDRTLDYSLSELITSNEKLTEINIQRHKIKDFIKRVGYFYGYVVPEIQWFNANYSVMHDHETHQGTMVIEEVAVRHFEQLNGYLDYVLDYSVMDAIDSDSISTSY